MKTVAILGAGITGLALAGNLSREYNVLLIEKEKQIGGLCGSFKKQGFTLDYGPHKLYPQNKLSKDTILSLYSHNPQELLEIEKKSKIALKGKFFDYPLRLTQLLLKFNPFLAMKLVFSYGTSIITNLFFKKETLSYEGFLKSKFGKGIYEIVFKSNAEKIWGNPKMLSADLAKTRISSPNLFKLILDTIFKTDNPEVNAKTFYYPKNSIQDLMDRLALIVKENNGKILTNSEVSQVFVENKKITAISLKGKKTKIDYLISTIPLKSLVNLLDAPKEIKDSASNLKARGLALVYLTVNKEKALKDNWIFFPGKDFIFQRLSEQKSFSSFNQPKNQSVLTAEISLRPEIEKLSDEQIIQRVKDNLVKIGFKTEDFSSSFIIKKYDTYPVYSLGYRMHLDAVLDWLDANFTNFITCGRNGLFNYNNMDHCIDMAAKIAKNINTGKEKMIRLRRYFESYKIVD